MNVRLLIDSIVRQTTVLIAQLATSGGVRAPLAHIANQVFLELARELDAQGVRRKVSADMFGMAIRAYHRKIQRLAESSTDRGRSLWEAIVEFIESREMVTRAEVLRRFKRDDETVVRSVLLDLTDSGMVCCAGSGPGAVYRLTTDEELKRLRQFKSAEGFDEFIWELVYRNGPLTPSALGDLATADPALLRAALERLVTEGRVRREDGPEGPLYSSGSFYVPFDAQAGWEAAVFDHFQALVQTACSKLRMNAAGAAAEDEVGGSTYTLDIWLGHPLEGEARGSLRRIRSQMSDLRARIKLFNDERGLPDDYDRVVVYCGQCLIPGNGQTEMEAEDDD